MRTNGCFVAIAALVSSALAGCGSERAPEPEAVGNAEVALTNAPDDAACVRVTAEGHRTDVRKFSVEPGENAVFYLQGLPLGDVAFSAGAFDVECSALIPGVEPTWYTEVVTASVRADRTIHVALLMIHNGQVSVGVDFGDQHAPSGDPEVPLEGGIFSSQVPYFVPVETGIEVEALLTVGDSPNTKPDGTPYRMVGIPDGLGAFDNGDGTFTLLANHELGETSGIVRAHGARGAFVSKWQIRKADLAVLHGEDLIQQVSFFDPVSATYLPPSTGEAFGRFCGAELAAPGVLYDAASDTGYDEALFFDGEEAGDEGRALAHALDGTSYELPRMGKMSFENVVPRPAFDEATVVVGLDDTGGGQVYVYAGTKTDSGSPVDRAGLTNGVLYGLKVVGAPVEDTTTGIADGAFEMHGFGNVESMSGFDLNSASDDNEVTKFQRPEDGNWDPNDPNDFYFVTTAGFSTPSRLWRLRFVDGSQPALGGEIAMLLDGSEGQHMFDNITLDRYGHVYLQEDPGSNDYLARIYRYDVLTDVLTPIARANPAFFDPSSPTFLTRDEESSGILDATDILGPGWFLFDVQSHRNLPGELVQDGQFLALYDPAADPEAP